MPTPRWQFSKKIVDRFYLEHDFCTIQEKKKKVKKCSDIREY